MRMRIIIFENDSHNNNYRENNMKISRRSFLTGAFATTVYISLWGVGSILKKHQIEELSLYLKHIATDKTNWN